MITRVGGILAAGLLLAGCDQGEPVKPKEPPAKPFKVPTLEETIVETGRREGRPQWDVDCDLAFIGNLDAAKRVREELVRLPFSQHSERSQMCQTVADTTIKKGGWK